MTRIERADLLSRRHAGFTMVESIISLVIVGVMLIAALNTLGATALAEFKMNQHTEALQLAQDLMTEILALPYEGDDGIDSIGLETGETGGTRSVFDDVDDFDGWSGAAVDKLGTPIPHADGFTRTVEVQWVGVVVSTLASLTETGVKEITVTVSRDGTEIVKLTAFRAQVMPDAIVRTVPIIGGGLAY